MEIITVTNQKGGAGKTTTSETLAAGLAVKGFKTLMIDLDPQENLSFAVGTDTTGLTSQDILMKKCKAADAIRHTENGDIIPACKALAGADLYITSTGKEYRLKEALKALEGIYDYIILDTPPALGILTVNALTASSKVLIPAQADIFSLQGIEQLSETIDLVRQYCNPSLEIAGIFLTRYSPRSVLSREVTELASQLAGRLHTRLLNAKIREAVCVRESQISQQNLFLYAPTAKVTEDYRSLLQELLGE